MSVQRLQTLMAQDPDVRQAAYGVFRAHGVISAQRLLDEKPGVFFELLEAVEDLVEQAPTQDGPTWLT